MAKTKHKPANHAEPINELPELDAPDIHPNAAEIEALDAQLLALGDPRAALEANATALAQARKDRGVAIAQADRKIGELMGEFRHLQKQANIDLEKIEKLRAKRAKLMGPDGGE